MTKGENTMVDQTQAMHQRVGPTDDESLVFWRQEFGVTISQLLEAVQAVGEDPQDVREHFLNQGSSAGAS
jgi:hypothetical protein